MVNLRASSVARIALILAQAFTGLAFILGLAAVSSLQHRANQLGLDQLNAADPLAAEPLIEIYDQTFNSGLQVPYPTSPQYQFEYQFFLAFFQLTIFLFVNAMAAFPRLVPYGKNPAMTFLAVALTLTMDLTNSLLYFTRTPIALQTYGDTRTKVALASVIIVAVANCATIIALGVWVPEVVESPEPYMPHNAKVNGFGSHRTNPAVDGNGGVAPHDNGVISHSNEQAGPDVLSTI